MAIRFKRRGFLAFYSTSRQSRNYFPVLLASGLWYTATVLTLPGWVHTKVNRIIWDFLWAGKTEVVKHDACILPCTQGGLSVVCVKEKAKALKLRWIPLLGDITYTAKWSYFGRYWIVLRLGRFFPDWAFLRDNSRPKYFGDDRPRIYKTCLTAADRVRSEVPKIPNFRVKTFYLLFGLPISCPASPSGSVTSAALSTGVHLGPHVWWSEYKRGVWSSVEDRSPGPTHDGTASLVEKTWCQWTLLSL